MDQVKIESGSIHAHLQILQSVIQRMASNSSLAKAWCITVVSAMLVIVADKSNSDFALISFIPTVLFLLVDTYYLSLEKGFRNSYNQFIDKHHANEIEKNDLYAISPKGSPARLFFEALFSPSIWPFYLTISGMILIVWQVIF